jgi:hypothetical protein
MEAGIPRIFIRRSAMATKIKYSRAATFNYKSEHASRVHFNCKYNEADSELTIISKDKSLLRQNNVKQIEGVMIVSITMTAEILEALAKVVTLANFNVGSIDGNVVIAEMPPTPKRTFTDKVKYVYQAIIESIKEVSND